MIIFAVQRAINVFIIFIIFNSSAFSATKERRSALVMEYLNGRSKVLYRHNASDIRYPASLTKMMTLYMLFEALQQRKISLDTKFKVSRLASNQMPSKLGLKQGEAISALDCIKALLVKSANDVAVVVAEGLNGSVAAFCNQMNKKAHSLGMYSTHFVNPSGVPDKQQVTTAVDISKLGLALYTKFPQYWHLFALKDFQYKGTKHPTHCRILQWYRPADGAKTGFICASGYNLWVTAKKYDSKGKEKRLFAIIFGGKTGKERDFEAASLLNKYFKGYDSVSSAAPKPIKVKQVPAAKPAVLALPKTASEEIYEVDSASIEEILATSGRSQQYFDELYKYDIECPPDATDLIPPKRKVKIKIPSDKTASVKHSAPRRKALQKTRAAKK